jgi:hypothetical protein
MTSNTNQYFKNLQYHQSYPYTPMINVPTLSRLPSMGEMVTSIELLTKNVSDLSRKIDRIESRVNDWVNLGLSERMLIAERGIDVLKTCSNDHDEKFERIATQIQYHDKDMNEVYHRIQDLVDQDEDTNKYIDRLSNILSEHTRKLRHAKDRSRDLSKKYAEIGILRRRISKTEEINTEFAECFETSAQLKSIISQMSNQVEECDKMVSNMVRYRCNDIEYTGCKLPRADDVSEYSNFIDQYVIDKERSDGVEAWKNVEEYFVGYEEHDEQMTQQAKKPASSFQCSPAMATCDGMYIDCRVEAKKDDVEDDDDFEKL